MKTKQTISLLEKFNVEEMESRLEMKPWIEYVPCDCDHPHH